MKTARHLDNSYSWRVEYNRKEPDRNYVSTKSVTVICAKIETAIAEVYARWPEATIIKAFRSERWGNDGVIVVDEAPQSGR